MSTFSTYCGRNRMRRKMASIASQQERPGRKPYNWLRVSDTTERSQVDQRIGHQLHAIVPLLDTFKSEQQPLEFVLPRKGPLDTHPQGMDGGVEQPLAPAL